MKMSNWLIAVLAISLSTIFISLFIIHYSALTNERNYSNWVDHTNKVIGSSNALLNTMLDAETDQRAFIITGDEKFLRPYYGLQKEVSSRCDQLKSLTKDHRLQYLRVDTLRILSNIRFDFLNKGISSRQNDQNDDAKQFIAGGAGKNIMDKFRSVINSFNAEEQRLLKERGAAADRQTHLSFETLFIGASIIMLVLIGLFVNLIREVNKRKEAHADLFISREWFSKTLLSTGDGVIATDQDGVITFMNRVAEELTGWSLEQTKGKALDLIFDIIDETTQLPLENPLTKALRENQVVLLTNHAILFKKDRTQHYIFDSAAPVHNQDSEVIGAVLIFRDVTEQSIARKKLAESESRLKDIVDNTSSLIYIKDLEGKYLMVNRQNEKVFNIKASEIIGKDSIKYRPPGAGRKFSEAHKEVIEQKHLVEFDKIIKHADGSYHKYHTTKFPLFDNEGNIYAVGGVSTDITETQKNSDLLEKLALREVHAKSEARFRALIENNHDMIMLLTARGIIEYLSPAAERIFGHIYEENHPLNIMEVMHPDDLETARMQLKSAFENPGVPIFSTVRNRKEDGSYIWVEGSVTNMLQVPGVNAIVGNFHDVTEKKEASTQQALLTSIVNSSDDAIISKTLKGIITSWNAGAEKLFGYTGKEAIGQHISLFIPQDRIQEETEIIEKIKRGEAVEHFETERIRKDGSRVPVSITVSPIKDKDGNVVGASKIARDITEKKEASTQQALLTSIVNSSDDAIISKTLKGIITSWNAGAEKLFGYTGKEAIGQHISLFIPQDRIQEETEIIEKIKRGEAVEHFETERIRKDGSRVPVSITVSPIKDKEGKVVGASKIARDITERKEAETQQALLTSIVNSSEDAIMSKTLEGIITSWNRGAEKLFGYDSKEIIGKNMSMLIPPDRLNEEMEMMEKIRQNEAVVHYETERIKKDGSRIYISLSVSPIKDISGKIVGASKIAHDITERKNSEVALQESELQIQAIIGASQDAVLIIDENGKITKWDSKSEALFGWKNEEIIGTGLTETIIPPRYREAHKKGLKHFLKTGEGPLINKTIEITALNKSNVEFDISLSISPVVIKEKYQFIAFIRDITARKREQVNLRQSEERYRQIVETAHEGIWTLDENHLTNFVNKKLCEILEYSAEEMMGKELYFFMDEEGKALTADFLNNRENESRDSFEFKYITKSGRQIWGSVVTNPIFGEDHKYKGALAMISDITERKHSEEKLRRSEANLRTIFNSTAYAYILVDSELKILSFNPIAAQWAKNSLKIDLKEGDQWLSYSLVDQETDLKAKASRILEGETMKYEVSYLQASGFSYSYEVTLSPVFKRRGEVMGICITLNDITDRKQLERETLQLVVSLQKRNNELKQFTYVISHNLRSPIAKILGLASLFEPDAEAENINQTLLSNITEAATSLDRVVRDLNTVISPRETVNAVHEYILFDAELDRIKKVLESEIKESKAVIESDFRQHEGIITITSYLYSILYNLISNSIKYRSPDVPLKIYLQTTDDKQFICLSVTDNGMGIDLKKNSDKIFGLYKRFHGETIPGKGIGLNLIKAQAESLGGRVEVESEVNKGTTFKVFLPKNPQRNATN